jgi:dTDP-4-dehydrorhamnose reductase
MEHLGRILQIKKNKNMKIYIFGSTGMLGRYVSTYLSQKFEVINISRKDIDVSKTNYKDLRSALISLNVNENDIIINCAGTIKPRVDELGDLNAILVNSVFPRILSDVCEDLKIRLIHPTTDCVYSGKKGKYSEDDVYDVYDVYGMSKALGEPKNCMVIRTSIIGEEVNQGRSLVEWVKSQKNGQAFGFTNHFWNGVTCLQFAKIVEKIINVNMFWIGVRHVHSDTLNKLELVSIINDVYDLKINVISKETPLSCDRSLSSKFNNTVKLEIPTLKTQIEDMKEFSLTLYEKNN